MKYQKWIFEALQLGWISFYAFDHISNQAYPNTVSIPQKMGDLGAHKIIIWVGRGIEISIQDYFLKESTKAYIPDGAKNLKQHMIDEVELPINGDSQHGRSEDNPGNSNLVQPEVV